MDMNGLQKSTQEIEEQGAHIVKIEPRRNNTDLLTILFKSLLIINEGRPIRP